MPDKKKRVLVIGLDGATFDLIRPLAKAGKLPNLTKLMQTGVHGELRSSIPPVTPAAWTSFSTGKNPAQHGIFNFIHHSPEYVDGKGKSLVSSASIDSATLWDILGAQGQQILVINIPITYPPWSVNGNLVSGLLAPSTEVEYTFPKELKEEIKSQVGTYLVDDNPVSTDVSNKIHWLDRYFKIEESRHRLVKYMLKNKPWDFFMVVYSLIDRICHLFWQYQGQKDSDLPKGFAEAVQNAYLRADQMVGEILELIDEQVAVYIMSDHGFGLQEKVFFTNCWLHKNGYLFLNRPCFARFGKYFHLRFSKSSVHKLLGKLRLGILSQIIPQNVQNIQIPLLKPKLGLPPAFINWQKTKAYAGNYGIYLNTVRGKIKNSNQIEKLRNEIIEKLSGLEDPISGEKIIEAISKREDIFQGPHLEQAPHIMFLLKGMRILQNESVQFKSMFADKKEGTHRLDGIFIAKSSDLKSNCMIKNAQITDLTPTILYHYGLEIPHDLDGKILKEIFKNDFFTRTPVKFTDYKFKTPKQLSSEFNFSDAEEEQIKEQLKGLGYL